MSYAPRNNCSSVGMKTMHVILAGRTFQCDLRGCRKQWELDTSTLGPEGRKVKDVDALTGRVETFSLNFNLNVT